jgi:hypothetical protein
MAMHKSKSYKNRTTGCSTYSSQLIVVNDKRMAFFVCAQEGCANNLKIFALLERNEAFFNKKDN